MAENDPKKEQNKRAYEPPSKYTEERRMPEIRHTVRDASSQIPRKDPLLISGPVAREKKSSTVEGTIEERYTRLRVEHEKLKEEYAKLQESNKRIDKLEDIVDTVQKRVSSLDSSTDSIKSEIVEIRNSVSQLERSLREMILIIRMAQGDNPELKKLRKKN